MINIFKKYGIIIAQVTALCGCGTNYTKEMSGIYKPYNEQNKIINDSAVLTLTPNGNFVYKVQNKMVLTGRWNAKEIREMTTVSFDSENQTWKKSGGSFNPPECNQIILWNPKYFALLDSGKVIFKKIVK